MLRIERAGGFVQDDDRCFGEQGAGDADALFLPAGEVAARFVDLCFVLLRQLLDKQCRAGEFGGVADLGIGCVRATVGDVLRDGGRQDDAVLQHQGHMLAKVGQLDFANVGPIKSERAAGRIIEPRQEIEHRGFAHATFADERDHFAGDNLHRHIDENRLAGQVLKPHVVKR